VPSHQQMAGILAGIAEHANTDGGPLTPQALIDTYCQPGMESSWRTKETPQSKFHAGFCGYDGQRGFDDGYDWLNELEESGWHAEHLTGKWPYVAQMIWAALPADSRYAIAHYCEGDFAIEVFPSVAAAIEGLRQLRVDHAAT
jgi:hypothetical protein